MKKRVLALTSVKADGNEALEKYLSVVEPLMEAAGAKLVSRHEVLETLSGSGNLQFVSIIDYPDEQAIQSVFDHPDYRSLRQVKEAAFSRYEVCVIN